MQEYPNVVIVKAFTKLYAIPGVRLGFLFCAAGTRQVRFSINCRVEHLNHCRRTGLAALDETEYCNKTIPYIGKERAYLTAELEKLGIKVYPGEADYLLLKTERQLYHDLLKKKF